MKYLFIIVIVAIIFNACNEQELTQPLINQNNNNGGGDDTTNNIYRRPIELLSYKGLVGNAVLQIPNKIQLQFNKPVKLSLIKNLNPYCITEIKDTVYADSSKIITFDFGCSSMGESCKMEIGVYDSVGNYLKKTLDIPFYNKKILLPGKCTGVFFDEQSGYYWMGIKNPNKITVLSSIDLTTIAEYSIPFVPEKMQLNPYNQKLYVVSRSTGQMDSTIYVIDPANGSILKSVVFHRDEFDHPQQPTIIPYDFAFSLSGYGIVLLMDYASSGHRWKIVDCTNDDSISIHPKWGWDIGQFPDFGNAYTNYDKSKIILSELWGSCQIEILDGNSLEFTSMMPTSRTRSGFLVPHRYENKFYNAQLYDQFIMDFNGNIGNISYLDNRGDRCADFAYIQGRESCIYYLLDGYFILLDYANSATLMYAGAKNGFENLTTTLDGKGIISYRYSYPNTEVYYFDTEDFYRYVDQGKKKLNSFNNFIK